MQSLTTAPFQTMAEVDQYLGGDAVECLLCGKTYQVLELHLTKTHDVLADDYRRDFGIPYSRALFSEPVATAFNATEASHCVGCAKDKRRNRPRPWRDKKAA